MGILRAGHGFDLLDGSQHVAAFDRAGIDAVDVEPIVAYVARGVDADSERWDFIHKYALLTD